MNYAIPFDSRDKTYKSRTGAVEANAPVLFRVIIPRHYGASACYMVTCRNGAQPQYNGMFWAGMAGEHHEWWDVTFTPSREGIYWYYFEFDTYFGREQITPAGRGTGQICRGGGRFQQTVYAPDYETPGWLRGGIMYQIFPDRFFFSGEQKRDVPSGRVLRDDWGAQPEYRPDARGKILNNDYFQGDLKGIKSKLDYLSELGVTCIYLNPVFEAHSSHRYDTADYRKIDPLLGTNEDFAELCAAAKAKGMAVIIDGVFSHTGADSIYFNRQGRYNSQGAYNSHNSPYSGWYRFKHWPGKYFGWWGFDTLPEVDEDSASYREYILGKGGIMKKWLAAGAGGVRLDVADELTDGFLDELRKSVKQQDPQAIIIGEVWEDASNKESYGRRRKYLLGSQLDSVMNYPFAEAMIDFVREGGGGRFCESVMSILDNYPKQVIDVLMNHIGTHDTQRILTRLAGEPQNARGRDWQAVQRLTCEQRKRGRQLLKLAAVLQYTLPGVPCVYYGDEAGMEGYADPFNRGCYPWGHEDSELLEFYRSLGKVRANCPEFVDGEFSPRIKEDSLLAFSRKSESCEVLVFVNRSAYPQAVHDLDLSGYKMLLGRLEDETEHVIPAYTAVIMRKKA